jgi:polyhydroxyalkanoate synthesis regulator phasin
MERDKEVIERIIQQIDISYEQACDVYDELKKQKKSHELKV